MAANSPDLSPTMKTAVNTGGVIMNTKVPTNAFPYQSKMKCGWNVAEKNGVKKLAFELKWTFFNADDKIALVTAG